MLLGVYQRVLSLDTGALLSLSPITLVGWVGWLGWARLPAQMGDDDDLLVEPISRARLPRKSNGE